MLEINLPIKPAPGQTGPAKLAGAKYDIGSSRLYIPSGKDLLKFERFIPLTVELVPSTSWYENVRSILKAHWPTIKKITYREYNYRCAVCGGRGDKHPVEAHETWHYDDKLRRQTLEKIVALCPLCHQVKHIGLAGLNGNYEAAVKHMRQINGWSVFEAQAYIAESFAIWEKRSTWIYDIDISLLSKYGYKAC